ncbi:MAG TPA: carboxypeptidase-like regulatory domain-containing protein [Terriglobia bacterium]|nr:carboxypeptidase-like regulatory domain-containing protein [Terriglobia bacterium]
MTILSTMAALLLAFQTGKASIEGTVLTTANKPIAGAQVTLIKSRTPGAVGGIIVGTVIGGTIGTLNTTAATTDAAGHFAFPDIEAGTYIVQAAADGYARQEIGPPPVGQPGMTTSVSVAAGQASTGVVLHLTQAGNVSGRITGSNGEPLANMAITLVRSMYAINGQRTLGQMATAQTNDKGEYRLFWATPGRYFLMVSSPNRPPLIGATADTTAKYPQTFYPGTKDIEGAVQIDVIPGGDLNGIDVRLTGERTFHVRGRVIDATTGQPPENAGVSIIPKQQGPIGIFSSNVSFNRNDGTFDLPGILSGSYWVRAQLAFQGRPSGGPLRQPTGLAAVEISNQDVNNVVVTIYPPMSVSGKIRVDGGARRQPSRT